MPFVYDDEFRVTTRFDVRIQSDRTPALSPDSTFKSIIAAFDNSATLDAVYLPEGASITLASASGLDLGALTRFGAPVPLPMPVTLFMAALAPLVFFKRKRF